MSSNWNFNDLCARCVPLNRLSFDSLSGGTQFEQMAPTQDMKLFSPEVHSLPRTHG